MRTDAQSYKGRLFVLLGSLFLGTTGAAQSFAPADASPFAAGAARMLIGGVVLTALALVRGELRKGPGWPLLPVLGAGVGNALFQIGFFNALPFVGVAVTSLVTLGSVPLLAGALGWLVRGERPTSRWALMTGIALTGLTLLVMSGGTTPGAGVLSNAIGVGLAALGGAGAAMYMLASKTLLATQPVTAVSAVGFTGAGLLLAPSLAVTSTAWFLEPSGIAVTLYIGLVSTALALTLLTLGLKTVAYASAATLNLAEPLTATALGMLLLGERVAPLGALGLVLLVTSLIALTIGPRNVADAPVPDATRW